ncbi:aldehyde dehydrogenase [Frigoriflavimonas asaccharolytica]|uniref:Aldehyde dehydrogenase n=1 Tax=Frigoriflavimonas asaccharolytica TaxID=2735899 RepID=A0A8J8GBQ7_9FLAO|nr:aldehyde dehydrogenase [Frigoriflavimonas asaccharolytica]NRS92767.1 aldehyde dehydrogenase (NAD+) [Frigoriflavimonas asaccharolytica]
MGITKIVKKQKKYFSTQETKSIEFRKAQLEKLKSILLENKVMMYEAIQKDFGKSAFDTYATEFSFILKDIQYYLKNLSDLARPQKTTTNLSNQIGTSKIYSEPLGCCLIIGAWNYPYQLSLSPVVAAIAAGNTCVLKPSEIAENTMLAMEKIINDNFPSEYLHIATGGVEETTEILKEKFDKIFFTGSTKVGQIVYEAAAKNLTPVILELGGKSPVIVTKNANLDIAAKRIVWGKFLNAGQTCVAPDYIYCDKDVEEDFLLLLKKYIEEFEYTPDSPQYTRIINERNFERLEKLIDHDKIVYGGKTTYESLYIQPTILHNVQWEDAVMKEEIFGPILPILSFDNFEEVLKIIASKEKPLSAYIFSNNEEEQDLFLSEISFGGGCINDVVMHLSNDYLPFGGVGNSGFGSYHGKYGFDAFSHQKAILKKATWGEPDLKYPPYTAAKMKWLKILA